jgi:type I restriction enzyme S subunit
MFSTRVSSDDLSKRLDANFYNPDFLAAQEKVGRFKLATLDALKAHGYPIGYGVIKPRPQESSSVRMVRIQNFEDPFVEIESAIGIDPEQMQEFQRSACKSGDILVAIGGYPGRLGIVPDFPSSISALNINQHVVRVRIGDKIYRYYLVAFLLSEFGRKLLSRQVSGSVQAGINVEDFREITIPLVSSLSQKYIGDKVHQAERLRAWAKAEREKIDHYFDSLLNEITLNKPEKRFNRISNEFLIPRLNAEYYSYEFVQVEVGLRLKFGKLSTIGKLAPTIRTKEKPTGDCRYFEIGDLSTARGAFEQGTFYKKGDAPNNAQRKFDIGDVAISTRRPNRGAIAVIEDGNPDNFYSVFLARLKPKNLNFGYWLKEFLRHEAGKLLLQQRCTWTTYPVISEDDLETIPIPVIEGDWEYISNFSRQSVLLENSANCLIKAAKHLVEALIEGQLSEAELVSAEQALQAGYDQPDRHILNRLKTDGVDGQGRTLFSDLDQLYSLLQQAENS